MQMQFRERFKGTLAAWVSSFGDWEAIGNIIESMGDVNGWQALSSCAESVLP
jgi:hypothetical protein